MTIIEFAVLAVALAIVVLVALLSAAAIELKVGIHEIRRSVRKVDEKMEPILDDLGKVAANLKVVTTATADKVGNVETVMSALGKAGEKVEKINSLLDTVMSVSSKPNIYWTGTKAAWSYVRERLKTKKGGR